MQTAGSFTSRSLSCFSLVPNILHNVSSHADGCLPVSYYTQCIYENICLCTWILWSFLRMSFSDVMYKRIVSTRHGPKYRAQSTFLNILRQSTTKYYENIHCSSITLLFAQCIFVFGVRTLNTHRNIQVVKKQTRNEHPRG